MKLDIYDFISKYDLVESEQFLTRADDGTATDGRYTFYVGSTFVNGEYCVRFFKVTFKPELTEVMYYDYDILDYVKVENFSLEHKLGSDGVGIIKLIDHLCISPEFNGEKSDFVTLECEGWSKFTLRNEVLDFKRISKKEFDAVQDRFYAQDDLDE